MKNFDMSGLMCDVVTAWAPSLGEHPEELHALLASLNRINNDIYDYGYADGHTRGVETGFLLGVGLFGVACIVAIGAVCRLSMSG